MKRIGLLAVAALILAPCLAAADEIAVTVYNSNLGVVSETRTLQFEKGVNRLTFRDVPALIDASSVTFDITGQPRDVTLLEQNYAFDLVSPEQMYQRYIDQQIDLIDKKGGLYTGKLLAFSDKAVTLQDESGRVKVLSLENIAEVNFPVLPEGLITRPTLFWLYRSDLSGPLPCRVGYQTSGMNWSAEYVGVLDTDESGLDLSGWASINNSSGKTYKDATLKLVAGEISRVTPKRQVMRSYEAPSAALGAEGFAEKEFFEYHLYTLPRPATVADKEIKQISLFEPATAAVQKVYEYRPEQNPTQVAVAVKFQNSKAAGLGMPLPAGRARLFKADEDGSLILLGEDRIKHTPKDEEVSLRVGYAFDIAAEEKMVQQTRISSNVEERAWEIELRNHKDEDITVTIEKRLYGYWEVMESNFAYEKKDAYTLTFDMPVRANQSAILRLKARFTTR
ncbi:MAG TPA: DUF4139 domain-containing protein [Acidobacteriota bacterium]|nr:DUF4139 domain-containing protein [Acidobacteriota bacterium]